MNITVTQPAVEFLNDLLNKNFVEILSSSVLRAGKYELTPDMTILDLLNT